MIHRGELIWRDPMALACASTWAYRVWANALIGFDCTVWVAWPVPEPTLRDPGPMVPGTTIEFTRMGGAMPDGVPVLPPGP